MTVPENPTVAELRAELERLAALMRAKGWPDAWTQAWISRDAVVIRLELSVDGFGAGAGDPKPFRRGYQSAQAFARGTTLRNAIADAEAHIAEMAVAPDAAAAAMAPWFEEVRG